MSSNAPCRVCTQEKSADQMVDIFETNGHRQTVAEVIIELTGLKVEENDGLPGVCCVQCQSDLTASITIRRKCIYSDNKMRTLLQSAFLNTEIQKYMDMDHIKQEGSEVEAVDINYENAELVQPPEISFEMDDYKLSNETETRINTATTSDEIDSTVSSLSKPTCSECCIRFDTEHAMIQHWLSVHSPDINERMVADDRYKEFGFGKAHISNSPTENPGDNLDGREEQSSPSEEFENNHCGVCKTYFVDFSSLQKHSSNCRNDETTNQDRQEHSTSASGEFCFVGLPATRLVNVSNRIDIAPEALNHDEAMGCCMCSRTFQSEAELMEHGKIVHAPKAAPASEIKPFQCNVCYSWFKTEHNVRCHQMTMRKRPFKCPTCGKLFRDRTEFVRHKNHHGKAPIFPCKYCGKRFVLRYTKLAHENICNNDEQKEETKCNNQEQTQETTCDKEGRTQKNICMEKEQTQKTICKQKDQTQETTYKIQEQNRTPVFNKVMFGPRFRYTISDNEKIDLSSVNHICCGCGTTFDTEDAMKQHANNVHAPNGPLADTSNSFKCNICYQWFKTEDDLRDHKIKMPPRKYKCVTCGEQFCRPYALVRHKGKHTKEPVFPCKFCGKLFVTVRMRLKHQQCEHILKMPTYPDNPTCCGCGSNFGTKDELLQHAQTVHAPTALVDATMPFRCNICYKLFSTEIKLRRHQVAMNQFQCATCGKMFSARSKLTYHEKVHTKQGYKCKQCGQTFHNQYAKAKHIRLTHRAEGPANHVCPTCGKTYTTADYLKNHMSLHEDKPIFKCHCGAEFRMKNYLYAHMVAAHSDRHKCRFCQATFKCASLLKGHENGHIGLKEYFCSVCNKGFHSQKTLGNHRARLHGTKSNIKKRKQADKC